MDKIKVLIIGAFTNGEAAKNQFALRQGWKKNVEIEFCGSNGRVVERLMHGPALAVVPIYNSIEGEITEVTQALNAAGEKGFTFHEVDRLDLPINQCLMVPLHIVDVRQVKQVFSHPVALRQCKNYLAQLGVTREHHFPCPSTGAAAEAVSRLREDSDEPFVAAIAPYTAAAHYGLRILAEHIQDDREAFTTFLLLEHV